MGSIATVEGRVWLWRVNMKAFFFAPSTDVPGTKNIIRYIKGGGKPTPITQNYRGTHEERWMQHTMSCCAAQPRCLRLG